jgi:hypothetical protein
LSAAKLRFGLNALFVRLDQIGLNLGILAVE